MSGIKDLFILFHWMDNEKRSTLEASFSNQKKVPRERQLILNELAKERKISEKKISSAFIKEKPAW